MPPDNVKLVTYADDISILSSGPNINALCDDINDYVPAVTQFLTNRGLIVSPEKSSVTLFTSATKEANVHPPVTIDGKPVPLLKRPKVLGVIHDTMYTFAEHCKQAASRMRKRNNVLKALSGTKWGQQKETMVSTYKAISRSVGEYAAPVWGPTASESSWNKLKVAENEALRIATGCHRMTDTDHLHRETKVLPIKKHAEMVSKQYLLSCYLPGHPGHKHVDKPDPPRRLKKNIMMERNTIAPLVQDDPITKETIKRGIKNIHTESVRNVLEQYTDNKLLNRPPPEIDKTEESLSRTVRSTLSQLRSSYSMFTRNYQARIDSTVQDICPDCNQTPHDVKHLFACPANPTMLTIESLWTQPCEVSRFLKLDGAQ